MMRSVLCSLVMLVCACHKQHVPSPTEKVRMQLRTTADSNGALPVYYAVRAVEDEAVFAEGYDAALANTLEHPGTAGVVGQGLLRPADELTTTVTIPRGQGLLLYVFFTSREGTWKLPLQRTRKRPITLLVSARTVEQQLGKPR